MAKKKAAKKLSDKGAAEAKELAKKFIDLEKKIEIAKQLIDEKDELITTQDKAIATLNEHINSDKGISDPPNAEIVSLKRQVKSLKGINSELGEQLKGSKKQIEVASKGTFIAGQQTDVPIELLIALADKIPVGVPHKQFRLHLEPVIDTIICLGEALMARTQGETDGEEDS
jgi:hypothetical protein